MRYMLLIGSDDKNAPPPTKAQMDAMIQGHMRFGQELHASGKMVVGERLRPDTDASRIRVKAGHRQVMDGPFAETKEALGGFYLIEAATKEEAVEWGRRSPSPKAASSTWSPSGRCSFAYHVCSWDRATHGQTPRAVADAHRGGVPPGYARVVASVLRIVRDIDTAEEVVQEAFAQALTSWPAVGMPIRPGAWLLTTARRRALDRLRRNRRAEAHADALAYESGLGAADEGPDVTDPEAITDDRLRLIFTCCHPGCRPIAASRSRCGWSGASRRPRSRARSWSRSRRSPSGWCAPSATIRDRELPLRGARRRRAARASARRAGGDLSDLQRGLRGARRRHARASRSVRGGDPSRPDARRSDAGRIRRRSGFSR